MRLALKLMALVAVLGIARVLFAAMGSEPADEWMRWAPSVDLRALAPGDTAIRTAANRSWLLVALNDEDMAVLATLDPARLLDPKARDPGALDIRLVRVELDGTTRHFGLFDPHGPTGCLVRHDPAGWNDPCRAARYDPLGRAYRDGSAEANLPMPLFAIRGGTLYLRPEQPN